MIVDGLRERCWRHDASQPDRQISPQAQAGYYRTLALTRGG